MPQIIKTYRQSVPAMRFIGKKYGFEDRVDGHFGALWQQWFANGWFEEIERVCNCKGLYEDSDATIGLMRWKGEEPFQYWIGMFCPPDTEVPEGFLSVDFPAADLGVCWVYGREWDVYGYEMECADSLKKDGFEIIPDEEGAYWFFERYACPRFTTPDEQGKIILDICQYVKKA